jgi:Ca2+-binding RTX toxin-like protein
VSWTLGAFVENLTLTGTAAINGTGNALANRITGNAAANVLDGGDGNDTLTGGVGADTLIGGEGDDALSGGGDADSLLGGAGNDRLDGGAGADAMFGGAGNDSYTVDDIGDLVDETDGLGNDAGGIDTVSSSVSWTLGAFVENLTLTGTAAINGTGNALANRITGNAAANVLDGGDGNDTISGGVGADRLAGGFGLDSLSGGADADTFVFTSLFAGRDTITDFVSGIDILEFAAAGFAGLSSGATVSLAINASLGSGIAGFTFNTSTKILAYDADGLGGLAATEIARLSTTKTLSAADFMII